MERLAELFESLKGLITFWIIINEYEKGLKFKCGKVVGELEPGFHWYAPIVGDVLVENIAYETEEIDYQSLTTKDDISITVASILSYRIKNIKKFLVDVEDANSVVIDVTYGLINEYVRENTWNQVRKLKFQQDIYEEIRSKAFKWGIEVVDFSFSTLIKSKTIRLIQD